MRKTTAIRLGFSGLVALVVLAAATMAVAAPSSARTERQFGARAAGPALHLSPALRQALRAGRVATAKRTVARSAAQGLSANLGPGEHPGFAYCGNDYAYAWPAYAPTHDVTLTRTFFVFSTSGNFSDAVVEPGPYYVIQIGEDYYLYEIEAGQVVYGPTEYADGWVPFYLPGNDDYLLLINQVITIDGGVAATPEYHTLTAIGPSVTTPPNVCRP
jgi:hypothetical protein